MEPAQRAWRTHHGRAVSRVRAHDDAAAAAAPRITSTAATAATAAAGNASASAAASRPAAVVDADRAVPHGLRRPLPDRLLLRGHGDGDLPHHHHVRDLRLLRLLPTDEAHAR